MNMQLRLREVEATSHDVAYFEDVTLTLVSHTLSVQTRSRSRLIGGLRA